MQLQKSAGPKKRAPVEKRDDFAEDLRGTVDRVVGELIPQGKRGEVVARLTRVMLEENYAGPIPHPRHFAEFENILPGSAERILNMAETSQSHHMLMDRKIIEGQFDDQKRGMRYGMATLVLTVSLAAVFGMWDQSFMAGLFLTPAVTGSIAVFVSGRWKRAKSTS